MTAHCPRSFFLFMLFFFLARRSFMYKMRYTFRQCCRSWWFFFFFVSLFNFLCSILYINACSRQLYFLHRCFAVVFNQFSLFHINAPLVHHTSIGVAFYLDSIHYEMRKRAHTRWSWSRRRRRRRRRRGMEKNLHTCTSGALLPVNEKRPLLYPPCRCRCHFLCDCTQRTFIHSFAILLFLFFHSYSSAAAASAAPASLLPKIGYCFCDSHFLSIFM